MLLLEVLDVELLVKVVAVDVMLVTCRHLQSNICTMFFLHKTNINRVLDRLDPFVQQTSFSTSQILFLFTLYD